MAALKSPQTIDSVCVLTCAISDRVLSSQTFAQNNHTHTGEAMPLITHLGLTQEANYFGHAAPFHCFKGEYKGHQVAIVTNGKDPKFGCDNVRREI